MMNEATNSATAAKTSSNVLKKLSDFFTSLLVSAAIARPVNVSVRGGMTAAIRRASVCWLTDPSPRTMMLLSSPGLPTKS